ncbi:MAG TPA: ABC transporter permease, partial [Gemmatimonadaceae bacterium]|nr:ABC transporter permease [Gemmatimonadaceae bacterium]
DETEPGHAPVVVLSEALWRSRFGGDPAIVGQQLDLDGTSRTVVGVMPSSVRYPNATVRLWVPLALDPANRVAIWSTGAFMIARLHPGVTLAQARAEVTTLAPQMLPLFPWSMPATYGRKATVVPLQADIVGSVRPMLLILLGAVGLVLLIACVNVANLMLVRTAARRRELAIRTALGAGARRLVRQLLTESVLLASLGGTVGLGLAFAGVRTLTALLPADTPRVAEIGIDGKVLGVTLVIALATGLAFGLVPALRAGRSDAHDALKEGGRGSSAGASRRRLNSLLVATEVALAVVLVTGAGLLMRSFWRLLQVDPGFRSEHVISATVAPPTFRYRTDVERRLFYAQLLQRVGELPGVSTAAVTTNLPFGGRNYSSVFMIDGQPNPAKTGNWPLADAGATVSPDYLRTLGIHLVRGRGFTPADRVGVPLVVLISESLAKTYWPNEDPIGTRIAGPSGTDWATIVGIVADVKHDQLSETHTSAFYRPLLQAQIDGPMSLVVRTTTDPRAFAASLRRVVASVDADTPVSDIRMMTDLISTSLARPRFAMALLAAFGALALVLGAVGIYGVLASVVGERAHEIGVRMALGAKPADVLRMVIRQGVTLTLVGIIVGILGSVAITRLLASLLYGVSAIDPVTFVGVPIVLIGVAVAASYLPARRAARVDPIVALRSD